MTRAVDILLVEDNTEDAELTLRALRKYDAGKTFHVARDGEEALDYLFNAPEAADRRLAGVRLILLDLKLPKIDGLEVLEKCKSDPRTRHIPIVILSSSREERDLSRSYRLGVNSYLVKPVDFPQFTDTVRQVGAYWMLLNQLPADSSQPSRRP
jgi:CheY-like chemotaxis protein